MRIYRINVVHVISDYIIERVQYKLRHKKKHSYTIF